MSKYYALPPLNHPPIHSLCCFTHEKITNYIYTDKYLTFSKAYNIVEKCAKQEYNSH